MRSTCSPRFVSQPCLAPKHAMRHDRRRTVELMMIREEKAEFGGIYAFEFVGGGM